MRACQESRNRIVLRNVLHGLDFWLAGARGEAFQYVARAPSLPVRAKAPRATRRRGRPATQVFAGLACLGVQPA
jgi:hypothetical protein